MKPTSIPSLLAAGLLTLAACSSATEYVPGPDSLMLAVRETVVVDTGFLYLHGNPIEPPYVFVIAGDSLYAELYINDYIADSIDKRPPDLDSLDPCTRLDYQIFDLLRQMRNEGTTTTMDRTERAAQIYREHPECADTVIVRGPGRLTVVHRDKRGNLIRDRVTLEPKARTRRPPTAYETVASKMKMLVFELGHGRTVFDWEGITATYPGVPDSAFAAWLETRPAHFQQLLSNPLPLERRRRWQP